MITNFQHNINTLVLAMREEQPIRQTILRKNTGTNIYTVISEFTPTTGIQYFVNKTRNNGKDEGTIQVDNVTYYGISYNNSLFSIPDSVVKEILKHFKEIQHRIK